MSRCTVPGCRGEVGLVYLGHDLCDAHWNELNADDASRERLRMVLGLAATTSPAVEVDMSETENIAAENAATEEAMATKRTEAKGTKKTRSAKAAKPSTKKAHAVKTKKQPKPKKEKKPKGPVPNRVFAIRVTDAELEAIHKASGPRNATRLIRAVAAAFASEDTKAFEAVVAEAKTLR